MLREDFLLSLLIESNQIGLYNYFRGDLLNHPDYLFIAAPFLTNYIKSDLFEEAWCNSATNYMLIGTYMDPEYIVEMKKNNFEMFEKQYLTKEMVFILDLMLSHEVKDLLESESFKANYDQYIDSYINENEWVRKTFDPDFLDYAQSPKGKHYFTKVLPNHIFGSQDN